MILNTCCLKLKIFIFSENHASEMITLSFPSNSNRFLKKKCLNEPIRLKYSDTFVLPEHINFVLSILKEPINQ